MPSFTFVSTANAFVLRGAVPVFVDIRAGHAQHRRDADRGGDHAATTRAIVPVHYAGVACEMDAIVRHRQQARPARDRGRGAGPVPRPTRAGRSARIGELAALSASTRPRTSSPARAARCWSTTRASSSAPRSSARRAPTAAQFFRGQVDKYTWVDVGLLVPARRDHRGLPVGADRGGGRDHAPAPRALERLPPGVRRR